MNPVMENLTKKCTKCGIKKSLKEFPLKKHCGNEYRSKCRACHKQSGAKWYTENKEKVKKSSLEWYAKNGERAKKNRQKWQTNNKKKAKEIQQKWQAKNREWVNQRDRNWHLENKEKSKLIKQRKKENAYKTSKQKINKCMSVAIGKSLKGNKGGRHWESLIGYTLSDLKCHLEKNFLPNMSWDNYGQWHVDHKIPISAFNFEKPEHIDFKKCWTLKNLQPMWAKDNISKSNKLNQPFQPSLKI